MATFAGNPAADPLTGAEIVPITQGGVDKRTTTQGIADLATGGPQNLTLVTEATAFTVDPGTHDGRGTMTLAGGDADFDSAEPYTSGMMFNLYATSAISLVESGVTLTDSYQGSHDLEAGMAVTVVMTGATTGIIIGLTVASS